MAEWILAHGYAIVAALDSATVIAVVGELLAIRSEPYV